MIRFLRRPSRALYRIRFRPGDFAVLEISRTLTFDQVCEISRQLEERLPEGVKAIILYGLSP